MFLRLFRKQTIGQTVVGELYVDGSSYCDTIENKDKQIATGYYPIRMTYSPHFEEVLPLLDNVVGRTGIRIHPGNTYRDSSGCILVGEWDEANTRLLSSRRTFNPLCESMRVVAEHREQIWIEIVGATRDKIKQDQLHDIATRNIHYADDYNWVSIPQEVIDILKLEGKWDTTPTWQSPR